MGRQPSYEDVIKMSCFTDSRYSHRPVQWPFNKQRRFADATRMTMSLQNISLIMLLASAMLGLIAFGCVLGCHTAARRSGWLRLSNVYAAGMMPCGRKSSFQSVVVGNVHYPNCVEIHASREGVFMRLPFGFNLGHRVLLIPWADLRHQKTAGRHHEKIRCEVGVRTPVAIELPTDIIEKRYRDKEALIITAASRRRMLSPRKA